MAQTNEGSLGAHYHPLEGEQLERLLRNFADVSTNTPRVSAIFHPPRFLEAIHWLG